MLYDSVSHLSSSSFATSPNQQEVVSIVKGVQAYVNSNPLLDNRVAAGVYIKKTITPALNTMTNAADKAKMLEINSDLLSSLLLVLQF